MMYHRLRFILAFILFTLAPTTLFAQSVSITDDQGRAGSGKLLLESGGDRATVSVRAYNAAGNEVKAEMFSPQWTSSDPIAVQVRSDGARAEIIGRTDGTSTVTVKVLNQTSQLEVVVGSARSKLTVRDVTEAFRAAKVEIVGNDPDRVSGSAVLLERGGDRTALTARAFAADGHEIALKDFPPVWSVQNDSIAYVRPEGTNEKGLVIGYVDGSTTVNVKVQGLTASMKVYVGTARAEVNPADLSDDSRITRLDLSSVPGRSISSPTQPKPSSISRVGSGASPKTIGSVGALSGASTSAGSSQIPSTKQSPGKGIPVASSPASMDLKPPGPAPTNVKVSASSIVTAKINWQSTAVAKYYAVHRAPTAKGPWTLVEQISGAYSNVIDTLAPNVRAFYRVRAVYPDSSYGVSEVASVQMPDVTPTSFHARESSPGRVELTWSGVRVASGYWITGVGVPGAGPANAMGENKLAGRHIVDGVPPGTYEYILITQFDIPGFSTVESNIDTAPRATVTVTAPPPPSTPSAGASGSTVAADAKGTYRITMNGFKAIRESWDSIVDFKPGDEIMPLVMVHHIGKPKESTGSAVPVTTLTRLTPAVNGIKTGSAHPNGCTMSGSPTYTALPLTLWEGELAKDKTIVVIVPTLWEDDGDSKYRLSWTQSEQATFGGFIQSCNPNLGHAGGCPWAAGGAFGVTNFYGGATHGIGSFLGDWHPTSFSPFGSPSDRPIGVNESNWFKPKAVVVNYDIAQAALAASPADGCSSKGTLAVAYDDDEQLAGKYILYLQIERVAP